MTCLVVRKGYRGRGLTYPLARAPSISPGSGGASALETYRMITQSGKEITWGEMHVGAWQVFHDAGWMGVGGHPELATVNREPYSRPWSGILQAAICAKRITDAARVGGPSDTCTLRMAVVAESE